MLSARRAVNGPWHYLYSIPHLAIRRNVHTAPVCRLHISTRNCYLCPRSLIQNLAILPQIVRRTSRRRYTGIRKSIQQKQGFNVSETHDQNFMRELNIGKAYQKLRQIALSGNYPQTQACVNILVRERGEKPNLRLYDALLLANADHEFGSVSEVVRILDEMAEEGINPDAATYHAILRVCYVLLSVIDFSSLCPPGSSRASRLSPTPSCY